MRAGSSGLTPQGGYASARGWQGVQGEGGMHRPVCRAAGVKKPLHTSLPPP